MGRKINLKIIFWELLIICFAFQRFLTTKISLFSYLDEVFAIIVVLNIIINIFIKKEKYKKEENIVIILLSLIIMVGVLGNIFSKLLTNNIAIITDIISMIKVWAAYFAIINLKKNTDFYDSIIKGLSKFFRVIVWIMFVCLIVSQFKNIGMTGSARYGIHSFKFLFNVPGNFSKLFYFVIPLLVADLHYKNSMYKKIMIAIALLIWISTLRSRAISFCVIFILLSIWYFKNKNREKTKKIKFYNIIIFVLIAACISWEQIIFYFTSSTQARAILLRYSIVTMVEYMPIGSGFGTYGSDVAAMHYSKLYSRYGFNNYYGMRKGEELFLNDNYWPMIIGQFGLIGFVLTLGVLVYFIKTNLKETKKNKYFYFASFCAIGFLVLSSIASKSYCEYSSICVLMLNGLLVQRERTTNNIENKKKRRKLMKKVSTKKNLLYNMVYQITAMILPLITAPYLARVIGAEGVGIYSYYHSISIYFVYFALLGISNYGNRLIAKNSGDEDKKNAIFSSIYYFQLITASLVTLIYLIYICFIAEDKVVSSIFALYVCSSIFDISWLFFGLQEFKTTSLRQIIIRVVNFACILIFVKHAGDLNKYVFIMCAGNFLSAFSLWVISWKRVKIVKCRVKDIMVHVKPCLILFIPIIATSVYRIMDIIMVGKIENMTEVGYYENAEKLIYISLGIIASFSAVMMPKISNFLGTNNKELARSTFENSMEIAMWIGCAMGFGIACVSKEFIPFYFGEEFYPSIKLSIGLATTIPIITWACIIRTLYLIPAEHDKIYVKSVVIGAIFNFVTNIILIPIMGTMGAVIGTIIAELSVAVYQVIKTHNKLNLLKSAKQSAIFLLIGMIMAVCVRGVAKFELNYIFKIALEMGIGAFVYLVLSYIYFRKNNNKYLIETLEKIKKFIPVLKNN